LKAIEESSLFLYSDTYVTQLLDALTFVVKLEKKSLVSEAAMFLNLSNCDFPFQPQLYLASKRPEKTFRHLSTPGLTDRVAKIAQVISQYANSDLIVAHLTENIRNDKLPRESIFLLNLMISQDLATTGAENSSQNYLFELAESYIDINLIKNSRLSGPLVTLNNKVTISDQNSDFDNEEWGQKLLVMDGMAYIAKSISSKWPQYLQAFERDYLSRILVYCISNVDVTNSHQAHVLYYVLNDCAKACGYSNSRYVRISCGISMSTINIVTTKTFHKFSRGQKKTLRPSNFTKSGLKTKS